MKQNQKARPQNNGAAYSKQSRKTTAIHPAPSAESTARSVASRVRLSLQTNQARPEDTMAGHPPEVNIDSPPMEKNLRENELFLEHTMRCWEGVSNLEVTKRATKGLFYMMTLVMAKEESRISDEIVAGIQDLTFMANDALDANYEEISDSIRGLRKGT